MPALLLRFLIVGLLAYIAGSTITPMVYTQSMTAQAEQTLSPFMLLSGGVLLIGVGYAVKQIFHR